MKNVKKEKKKKAASPADGISPAARRMGLPHLRIHQQHHWGTTAEPRHSVPMNLGHLGISCAFSSMAGKLSNLFLAR